MNVSACTPVRIAYIRTILGGERMATVLDKFVLQTTPKGIEKGLPRHSFLLGAANPSDTYILDTIVERIQLATLRGDSANGICGTLLRSDLEVRISVARASTNSGKKVIQKCKNESIPLKISGNTDEECDDTMLRDSHYLIDALTPSLLWNYDPWFYQTARVGQAQDNILTNPAFPKTDASTWRLAGRYSGHGWKASSGNWHGNSTWRCRCGGKCKRGRCKGAPTEEETQWINQRGRWIEERVKVPEPGDEKWRDLTAADICERFRLKRLPGLGYGTDVASVRGSCVDLGAWESIDTFSGEWRSA